ncbi:MAG: TlpA family protein disulfide reductase [Deltaproteobacteria bacterium]
MAILALLFATPALAEDDLKVGDSAPSFTLPVYNPDAVGAGAVSLDSYVGADADDPGAKLVLLSFFATFCAPCQREIPTLVALEKELRPKGLRVLLVSIDRDDAAAGKIAALAKQDGIRFPILRDRFDFLARRYLGEKAPLPSVFLVGRDGQIREMHRGYGADGQSFLRKAVLAALTPAAAGPSRQ